MTPEPRYYAQRMLNPFHGVVNVVEIDGADAVTRDGETWQLYIQGEQERAELPDGSVQTVRTPDIKFGTWSPADGLCRAPVRFVTDYAWLDAMGSALLAAVKELAPRVPFALTDDYEFWLLAAGDGAPLALLESVCRADQAIAPDTLQWRAGQRAQAHFARQGRRALGERLAAAVARAAGPTPRGQWFRRRADGGGEAVSGEGALVPQAFPPLLLRRHWPEVAVAEAADAYLRWQAPWLLQLQRLTRGERAQLERAACTDALALERNYRLFPAVVDEERITAARVEARMRPATEQAAGVDPDDAALLPFFNE